MKHQTKPSFILVGRSILIEGTTVHEQHYSKEKTAFYAQLFKEGMLGKLMPHSLDKKGYALIVPHKDGIQYYAGVAANNAVAGYESILVPEKDYLVSSASGDKSRLLFDQLEDNFFEEESSSLYQDGIILEILLNGNPMDAEVELWVPNSTN